jgi:hypothetical protein
VDHDHLFVHMVMRRVRRTAGGQLGDVQIDGKARMRFAIEDGPRGVRPGGADGRSSKRYVLDGDAAFCAAAGAAAREGIRKLKSLRE